MSQEGRFRRLPTTDAPARTTAAVDGDRARGRDAGAGGARARCGGERRGAWDGVERDGVDA